MFGQITEATRGKVFSKDVSDKGLSSEIYKEFQKTLMLKVSSILKLVKRVERHLTEEDGK